MFKGELSEVHIFIGYSASTHSFCGTRSVELIVEAKGENELGVLGERERKFYLELKKDTITCCVVKYSTTGVVIVNSGQKIE